MKIPFLKVLTEEPADFLNPYWYEQMDGINWNENGNCLVIYDRIGPVWNPHFPSSLFLNHGVKRIHLVLISPDEAGKHVKWIGFFLDFLPNQEKVMFAGKEGCKLLQPFQDQAEDLLRRKKGILIAFHSHFSPDEEMDFDPEHPSFSMLQKILQSAYWALIPEGNGFSIFSTQRMGSKVVEAISEKAKEQEWSLYWIKDLYDFSFSDRDSFQKAHELPSGVKQLV